MTGEYHVKLSKDDGYYTNGWAATIRTGTETLIVSRVTRAGARFTARRVIKRHARTGDFFRPIRQHKNEFVARPPRYKLKRVREDKS
jgi:hypothetical protein